MRSAVLALGLIACGGPTSPPPVPQPSATPSAASSAPSAPSCPQPGACVSRARLERDVRALAVSRPPGSKGHAEVRERAAAQLRDAGFALSLDAYGTGTNIIARLDGEQAAAIVVSAHYDHVNGCSGADDNASGMAAVLELARVLARPERRYAKTLVLALWDEEELGLVGSMAWTEAAQKAGRSIAFALSLDGIGYADATPGSQAMPAGVNLLVPEVARSMEARGMRGDFIAVVGDQGSEDFVEHFAQTAPRYALPVETAVLNPLKKLAFGDAQRSDHASFWLRGFPAVLLTDTANYRYGGYHCGDGDDAPGRLNYAFLHAVTATLADTITHLAGAPASVTQ